MTKRSFILFLFLFLASFILSFLFNCKDINLPYFGGINKKVTVDIIFEKNFDDILINNKKAENIIKIDHNHYIFSNNSNTKTQKIIFKNPQNIKKLTIYNDKKATFYNEVNNEIIINASKTFIEKLGIGFLSFFYNPKLYIVPYLILFLMAYKINIGIKNKYYIISILILCLFLRIIQLNTIPFWDDEIYSIVCTEGSFFKLLNDPGNPPLYFLILKLYKLIVHNEELLRFSSVLIGVLFNFAFYIYLKTTVNSKTARIGVFATSINLVLIYFSQELRCYMLLMLLTALCSTLLFNFKGKKQMLYLVSITAILYTHFYGTFFVLYNLIFGLIRFKKEKLKNFLIINMLAFISFAPFLIYKKESITSDFNSWIEIPKISDYMLVFETFSGKSIVFVLFLVLTLIFYILSKKKAEKIFISYNFLSIVFVLVSSVIFSYLIKPIFCYRYFYVVFPMYLALVSLYASKKYSFGIVFNFIIIFAFVLNSRINYQNLFCNHNLFVNFIEKDIDTKKNNYIFMSDTVKGYKKFEEIFKNKAKIIYLPVNKGIKDIDPNEYNISKENVSYILNLYLKNNAIINASQIELHKTPLGVYLKAEYR